MVVMYFVLIIFIALTATIFIIRYFRKRYSKFQELIYMLNQNQYEYILLDVRNRDEYARGHLPEARNVPFNELHTYMPTENMFEKIFLYGRNYAEARKARGILGNSGYFNVQSFGSYRAVMRYENYLQKEKTKKNEY